MAWFRRKKKVLPERYDGKPLLVFLENYVLDCIGYLPPEKSRYTGELIDQVIGGGPDWKATLRRELHIKESTDEHLRTLWLETRDEARKEDVEVTPVEFAIHIVDETFSKLIEESGAEVDLGSASD